MRLLLRFFFFNDSATTGIYTLSLHDALPISALHAVLVGVEADRRHRCEPRGQREARAAHQDLRVARRNRRSEEHTSELQSRRDLVCRLLLEKKKTNPYIPSVMTVTQLLITIL